MNFTYSLVNEVVTITQADHGDYRMALTDFRFEDPLFDYGTWTIFGESSDLYHIWAGSIYATDLGTWRISTYIHWVKIIVLGTSCADMGDTSSVPFAMTYTTPTPDFDEPLTFNSPSATYTFDAPVIKVCGELFDTS